MSLHFEITESGIKIIKGIAYTWLILVFLKIAIDLYLKYRKPKSDE